MPTDLWGNDLPDDAPFNGLSTEESSFRLLFHKDFIPLCAYCRYQYSFDLDLAREAAHTAFIRLWETRRTLNGDLNVKAYLYRIASNICIDIIRQRNVKRKYEKYMLDHNAGTDPGHHFSTSDTKALREAIDKAVAGLPEKMRQIFELSRYEGLKYAQIAQRLNISVNTVETQMSRALVKLKQKLGGLYFDAGFILLLSDIFLHSL